MIKNAAKRIYLVLICLILYAPIVTLMVLSFNNTKTRSRWGGFTGKWYVSLFQNKEIMNALYTTLIIALLSALIATLIGTLAALGMQVMRSRTRTLFMGITNIPMLNADIVTGVSLMLLFIAFRLTLGFKTILLAHITFNIPYVILSVMPHWTSVLLRSMLLSRLSCLTSCREFFQDFFWHSQCHWMILLSPTLPRGLESILFPQKSTVKSEKGSNRKCMHFQL